MFSRSNRIYRNGGFQVFASYWILLTMGFVAAIVSAGCTPAATSTAGNHAANGKPIIVVNLLMLGLPDVATAGPSATITQLEPKITMLHFWGTWCGPCRAEYPELAEMLRDLDPNQLQFYSISCEASADDDYQILSQQTNDFFQEHGIRTAAYCDPTGQTRTGVAAALGNVHMAYPTTVILDVDQKIIGVWEGYLPTNVEQMKRTIQRYSGDSRIASENPVSDQLAAK